MDVTIVDCGIGNVRSVLRMFEAVDVEAAIAFEPGQAVDSRRLVLPGVGAFDAGMEALNRGWREMLDMVALCDDPRDVIAAATHGSEFTTAIAHGNIFGVQFHPEKSHRFGMALMRRFASL